MIVDAAEKERVPVRVPRLCTPGRMLWLLLSIQVLTVSWCAVRNSFSWTEVGLLPSGIIDWRYGDFVPYRVNPPLIRMWATLPLMALNPDIPYRGYSANPRRRSEWDVARSMIDTNGEASWTWLTIARLMCLPFTLLGTFVAYRWARELFGWRSGIGAAALLVFSPLMMGLNCLMSGDAQAACMGLVTLYVFRKWLKRVSLETSYLLGVVTGVTVLTKTSWFAMFGLLPLLWLLIRAGEFYSGRRRGVRNSISFSAAARETGLAIASMALCLLVINLAYGGDGSLKPLGEYQFISKALTDSPDWEPQHFSGNRFAGTWLASLPVPLPEDLVIGMDLQKWDFDRERWSYFLGEWRNHGWWYYYLFGLFAKTPLATWLLALVAVVGGITWRSWRERWQEFLILSLPIALILTAASAETGLNRHIRYVLPVVPMGIVLISRVFRAFAEERSSLRYVVAGCLSWTIISSLWIYPHSHSYFNEAIGGPLKAHHYFNASNLDWGQDLRYLKEWSERNPDRRPLWVKSYLHLTDPQKMGISTQGHVPTMPVDRPANRRQRNEPRFSSGWYAIDTESVLRRSGDYRYLESLTPAEYVGYAFRIYHLTPEIAAEFNRQYNESARN